MKSILNINILMAFLGVLSLNQVNAQIISDSTLVNKEYTSLDEALDNPNLVYRLNLSDQESIIFPERTWDEFQNLEYLSLKNVHLKEIPSGIGNLKNLKVLDISGNDFKMLPQSFSGLESLTEIYLNDENEMDVDQSLSTIKDLPKLRILHLENDNLKSIPVTLLNLTRLEALYLDSNRFDMLSDDMWTKFENLEYLSLKNDHLKEIPAGIGKLKNLKVLDLSGNDFTVLPQSFSNLENLQEIYLNDEIEMDVNQSLSTIKDLPNLKVLHLENDNLESIPQNLLNLTQLEALYLNKNSFHKIPIELDGLSNLNFIDFHDNKFKLNIQDRQYQESFKLKIRI